MIKQLNHLLASEFDPGFEQRARFIFENIEKYKPKKILDAGCGRGFYSHAVSFYPFINEIQGFDINESYLRLAISHCTDSRITLKKADLYHLPYPDSYFDFIIFSEVLEHLIDEKKALQELKRVLKKNGVIALSVPNIQFPFLWDPLNWLLMRLFNTHIDKNIWWLAGIWADHESLYSQDELKKIITDNSFMVKRVKNVIHWSWPFSHFILYGIGKNIVERLEFPGVSRFEFKQPNPIVVLFAYIMKLPSTLLDRIFPSASSVNICTLIEKK